MLSAFFLKFKFIPDILDFYFANFEIPKLIALRF